MPQTRKRNNVITRVVSKAILPEDFNQVGRGKATLPNPIIPEMHFSQNYLFDLNKQTENFSQAIAHVINGVPQTERGRQLLAEANRKLALGLDPKETRNNVGVVLGQKKLEEGRETIKRRFDRNTISYAQ